MDILIIIIHPTHKHGISLHFFGSSSTSLIVILVFSVSFSIPASFKFIPTFFLFDATVNGIVFLIFLSDWLLLVYRNVSVQFSCSVVSDSLWPHGLQHSRPPCPSPTPRIYSNSCPLSRWCHSTISSSVVPFSPHLQSFLVTDFCILILYSKT